MTPAQLSAQLTRIANAIDASKNPDRGLVARDLKVVLAALSGKPRRASDWDAAGKMLSKIEKLFGELQKAVKNQDDEAANIAGALGGFAQDLEKTV